MKFGRLVLYAALATLCSCRRSEPPKAAAKPAPPSPRLKIVTDRVSLADLERLPLDEAVRRRPDVYRLRPDRRFLIALGELELLVSRKPQASLHLAWRDGAWHIDSVGVPLGTVPEMATYADWRSVLEKRARTLVGVGAPASSNPPDTIRAHAEAFEAARQIQALKSVDAQWPAAGLPNPELISLAAQAAVALSVQSLDTLEIADLVPARAMAVLALASALDKPRPGDEALMAATLGYWPDAARLARALPEDGAVRLYAESRTTELVGLASRNAADAQTRYLALLSLGRKRDRIAWEKFQDERFRGQDFSLPVLKTAAELNSFEVDASLGNAVLYAAMAELTGPPKAPASSEPPRGDVSPVALFVAMMQDQLKARPQGLAREFESRLAPLSAASHGPLWDADATRAWHRGAFYSGLHRLGRRYLDQLAAPEATREFSQYLEGSPEGVASQFGAWYRGLSAELSGSPEYDRQFDELLTLTALGSPAVYRVADGLRTRFYKNRDSSALLAERVARRLDGRPVNVGYMNQLMYYPLYDLRLVEAGCRSWLQRGWSDDLGTAGRCLRFLNDTENLVRMLERRDLDLEVRAGALASYCQMPDASESLCRSRYRLLAEESRYERIVVRPWIDYVERKLKDYAGAQRIAEGWLSHHDRSAGLIWFVYRGRLAHLMSLQGRHREAWATIEPVLSSSQGAVMTWAVEILEKLGRTDDAYALARQTIDRYPDSEGTRIVLADMLWRQKRFSEAALVLSPPQVSYQVGDLAFRDELTPRFAQTFAKAPDAEVETAVGALQGQGIRARTIAYLFPPLAATGRADLAFQLQTALSATHQHIWDVAVWKLEGYRLLEKSKGREAAVAWIREAIPPPQREASLESFFNRKAWSLLWDAVPPAEETKQSEWVWLMRAGATTVDQSVAATHREDLRSHYAEANPRDLDRTLARHLLGLEPRDAVLAAITKPDQQCKAAYFLALPEIGSGHYDRASDGFQLVYGTCSATWSWRLVSLAEQILGEWYTFGQTLDVAAEKKVW